LIEFSSPVTAMSPDEDSGSSSAKACAGANFPGNNNLWLERSIPDGLQRRLPPGRVVMVDLGSFAEDLSGLIMVRTGEKFFYFPAEKNEGQS